MIETEVKFLLTDPEIIRQRLRRADAVSAGNSHEINYRYDDADNRLRAAQHLLRLRRDSRNRLTLKQPHPSGGSQFKTHNEIEIDVSDFDTTHHLLEALGYHRAQIYEKHRETYKMEATEICLDHLPYGYFVEIEGTPEAIPFVAERLGLVWHRRILANYLQIFDTLRQSLKLPFNDVTFANFAAVSGDLVDIIRHFEVESPP